jgi:hypothetical protein
LRDSFDSSFRWCAAWEVPHNVAATREGAFELLACLHVLANHIAEENAIELTDALLTHGCFPPAAFALLRLVYSSYYVLGFT